MAMALRVQNCRLEIDGLRRRTHHVLKDEEDLVALTNHLLELHDGRMLQLPQGQHLPQPQRLVPAEELALHLLDSHLAHGVGIFFRALEPDLSVPLAEEHLFRCVWFLLLVMGRSGIKSSVIVSALFACVAGKKRP